MVDPNTLSTTVRGLRDLQFVTFTREGCHDVLRHAWVDVDDSVACVGIDTRKIDGGLNVSAMIQHGRYQLHLALWLIIGPHDPEGGLDLVALAEHRWNNGVHRALVRRQDVGM